LFALIPKFVPQAFGPIPVRQPAGDEHVSPVESKQLDQLVEPAQVAICGEDEAAWIRSGSWRPNVSSVRPPSQLMTSAASSGAKSRLILLINL